jgi:hypothetical protein
MEQRQALNNVQDVRQKERLFIKKDVRSVLPEIVVGASVKIAKARSRKENVRMTVMEPLREHLRVVERHICC